MAKKRGWFSFVKRLFIPETKPPKMDHQQKSKKWGWVLKRLKFKKYPEIAAPQKTLSEATEEQRKHVLAVAIATAAAAEAAVAAANAAAEVVKLTNLPHEIERRRRNSAAIKIQTAYRRHLAMKALSALKGLVKLQAVIRGEIVRRKVVLSRMKFRPSFSKKEPKMCRIRVPIMDKDLANEEWRQTLSPRKIMECEELKLIGNETMSWDFSLVSKEEMEAMWLKKQEALIKRERMKKYSYSHRERRNDQTLLEWMSKENGRKSYLVNKWKEVEFLESAEKETEKMRQLKLISKTTSKQDSTESLNSPSFLMPRRSFCRHKSSNGKADELEISKSAVHQNDAFPGDTENMGQQQLMNLPFSMPRRSLCDAKQKVVLIREDFSLPNSPTFPAYMAATESAKAKIRSMSTPKQRLGLSESYADQHSPCKIRNNISSWNSFSGEAANLSNRKSGISLPVQMNINSRGSCWD